MTPATVSQMSYNLNGNRIAVIYPGSLTVSNAYDNASRLVSVIDWNGRQTAYAYDEVYSLTNTLYPNGVRAGYVMDVASRMVGLSYLTNQLAFLERSYSLNAAGSLTQEQYDHGLTPALQPIVQNISHDNADRLTQILQKTVPDQVSCTTNNYFSDAAGSLVSNSVGMAISYDCENRATNYVVGAQTNQYRYDGMGNRVSRTTNGVERIDVLDRGAELHNVLMVTDAAGNPKSYFIWGNGLLAQVLTNGATYCYHPDRQGSTLAMTDTNGAVVAQYVYGPYGEILNQTGSIENPYTWIGGSGVWSDGSDLYHMKARYYHAGLKRFISADPIGLAGGGNLFAYCADNPVNSRDPLGLCGDEAGGEKQGNTMDCVPRATQRFIRTHTGKMVDLQTLKDQFMNEAGEATHNWITRGLSPRYAPAVARLNGVTDAVGTNRIPVGGLTGLMGNGSVIIAFGDLGALHAVTLEGIAVAGHSTNFTVWNSLCGGITNMNPHDFAYWYNTNIIVTYVP